MGCCSDTCVRDETRFNVVAKRENYERVGGRAATFKLVCADRILVDMSCLLTGFVRTGAGAGEALRHLLVTQIPTWHRNVLPQNCCFVFFLFSPKDMVTDFKEREGWE